MHPTITKLGFGVGMDLPWGTKRGFDFNANGPNDSVACFLAANSANWQHFSFAFQPRNRNPLRITDYFDPWKKLIALIPKGVHLGFHHTLLNMAYGDMYPHQHIVDFTNDAIATLGIEWIVEDLGIWSINGKSLPYPLPPLLTEQSLETCIANVSFYRDSLNAPLSVEFPGFTDGSSLIFGPLHAFDFFASVARETGCLVTLDTGHILGYWHEVYGSFDELYDNLERLPLDHCFELHLSGAQIRGNRFIDSHNGVLMSEQIELASWLMKRCNNLRAVTYEDPIWDQKYFIAPQAKTLVDRLVCLVSSQQRSIDGNEASV